MGGLRVDCDYLLYEDHLRGHQGEVFYEGKRCGAVFRVTLPPFVG